MLFRSLFFLVLWAAPLSGQAAGPASVETPTHKGKPPVLKEIAAWKNGMEALDMELWDIADKHFSEALATPDLSSDDQRRVEWQRLQAWIRGGRPGDALQRLSEEEFATQPETYFWKSQALAALGRFREAVDGLAPAMADAKAAYRHEALLTRANLQLALGDQDGAFETLEVLSKLRDPKIARLAKLRQTSILIDQGKTAEARKLLPAPRTLTAADLIDQAFLDARLLLAEGKTEEAVSSFAALRDQSQGQSQEHYHTAILGLADALVASGNTEAAAGQLLAEIQKQKDTPLLEAIFQRLLKWLPARPAADDPILERLKQWIPPAGIPSQNPLGRLTDPNPNGTDESSGALGAIPSSLSRTRTPDSDLVAFSLYTRAIGCHRQQTPDSLHEADSLMTRLRLEFPDHFLIPEALMEVGRWRLSEGKLESAFAALDAALLTGNPAMRGEAAFLKARAEYDSGRPEAAQALFDEASALLPDRAAEIAGLNAALIRLQSGATPLLSPNLDSAAFASLQIDLELERGLSDTDPNRRFEILRNFVEKHPTHERIGEARLAAASAALKATPHDSAYALSQMEAIEANPALKETASPERLAWLRLEIADHSGAPEAVIASARQYLEAFPETARAPEVALILGRAMFRNQDYHNARLVLEKMAGSFPEAKVAPAALMLAARAAALGATDQSRNESLALYERVIDGKGPLASLARLERASLLNETGRLDVTVAELKPWFDSLKPGDPLRVPAGLLLGDALYAQAASNSESLTVALGIYDELLAEAGDDRALFNRLQYQRGMAYERLPVVEDGASPASKALECYFSVLQSATEDAPAEWKWFENCGFRALKLLEDDGKWRSAMKVAQKIASFNGPRSQEAAERAKTIRMEQKIYED